MAMLQGPTKTTAMQRHPQTPQLRLLTTTTAATVLPPAKQRPQAIAMLPPVPLQVLVLELVLEPVLVLVLVLVLVQGSQQRARPIPHALDEGRLSHPSTSTTSP